MKVGSLVCTKDNATPEEFKGLHFLITETDYTGLNIKIKVLPNYSNIKWVDSDQWYQIRFFDLVSKKSQIIYSMQKFLHGEN